MPNSEYGILNSSNSQCYISHLFCIHLVSLLSLDLWLTHSYIQHFSSCTIHFNNCLLAKNLMYNKHYLEFVAAYIIHPYWCIGMGHQGCFLWVHGRGSCNIRPPLPNDPVAIDLTPTPNPAAKLRIFHTRQMIAEMALFMGITFEFWQQPIKIQHLFNFLLVCSNLKHEFITFTWCLKTQNLHCI